MGVNMYGWVEVKISYRENWDGIIKIDELTYRWSDIFGSLFGVRNFTKMKPIAASRGLPLGLSKDAMRDSQGGYYEYAYTWISWAEIKAIDWDEESEDYTDIIHMYTRDKDGNLSYEGGYSNSSTWPTRDAWPKGQESQPIEEGDTVYKLAKFKRSQAKPNPETSWGVLFTMMGSLAAIYGDENVRLVAWFS